MSFHPTKKSHLAGSDIVAQKKSVRKLMKNENRVQLGFILVI
jgi:hypothetical protein